MKNLWMMLPFLTILGAESVAAKMSELHLAQILDITQVSSTSEYRSFEVTFNHRCKDRIQGTFVNLMPQPFITEHTHHVVGVMAYDTGITCKGPDRIEKLTVQVPIGDTVDKTPLLLQPGE